MQFPEGLENTSFINISVHFTAISRDIKGELSIRNDWIKHFEISL